MGEHVGVRFCDTVNLDWLHLSTSTVVDYRSFSLIAEKLDGYSHEVKRKTNEGESGHARRAATEANGDLSTIPEGAGQCIRMRRQEEVQTRSTDGMANCRMEAGTKTAQGSTIRADQ